MENETQEEVRCTPPLLELAIHLMDGPRAYIRVGFCSQSVSGVTDDLCVLDVGDAAPVSRPDPYGAHKEVMVCPCHRDLGTRNMDYIVEEIIIIAFCLALQGLARLLRRVLGQFIPSLGTNVSHLIMHVFTVGVDYAFACSQSDAGLSDQHNDHRCGGKS